MYVINLKQIQKKLSFRYEWSVGLTSQDKPEGIIDTTKDSLWHHAGKNMEAIYCLKQGNISGLSIRTVPGTFTHLKRSLVPLDFKECCITDS